MNFRFVALFIAIYLNKKELPEGSSINF